MRVIETNASSVSGAEKTLTITCSGTVSIDDSNIANGDWNIYPNPTKQYIYLASEKLTEKSLISVYTLCGKTVLISDYSLVGKQAKIDLEALPFGVYLLQVKTDHEIRTFRIIKD